METAFNNYGSMLVDEYVLLNGKMQELKNIIEKLKTEIVNYGKKEQTKIVLGSHKRVFINEFERIGFPKKGTFARTQLKILLKELDKLHLVSDLDVIALGRVIKERKWDEDILNRLNQFSQIKKFYVLKIDNK